jgi:pimeloyl-ACP methyl ester carboxylesterase
MTPGTRFGLPATRGDGSHASSTANGLLKGMQVILLLAVVAAPSSLKCDEPNPDRAVGIKDAPRRVPTFVPETLDSLFDFGSWPVPEGICFDRLEYRLFKPQVSKDEKYPLIVFFHGHGSHEMNWRNVGQLKHLDQTVFLDLDSPEKYQFFLLAVQCPKKDNGKWMGWTATCDQAADSKSSAPAEMTMAIVDDLLQKYQIDRERVCLFGISSGGGACWELAMRYPERFAAVVPTASGGVGNDSRLTRVKNVPIWAFRGSRDSSSDIKSTIDALRSLGGKCYLTETPARPEIMSGFHNCWYSAFQDYGALEWMLAQRRNSMSSPPPGTLSYSVRWRLFWRDAWPRLVPVAIVVAVFGFYYVERRRRKSARPFVEST